MYSYFWPSSDSLIHKYGSALALGDQIRKMGFKPTRADPDLWIKESDDGKKYEYMATYVDDIIIVGKDPMKYLDEIKKHFPIRNIEMAPEYYLGSNIDMRKYGTIKISSKKYITKIIRRYEIKYGTLQKQMYLPNLMTIPRWMNHHY